MNGTEQQEQNEYKELAVFPGVNIRKRTVPGVRAKGKPAIFYYIEGSTKEGIEEIVKGPALLEHYSNKRKDALICLLHGYGKEYVVIAPRNNGNMPGEVVSLTSKGSQVWQICQMADCDLKEVWETSGDQSVIERLIEESLC